jgi:hypothetical protein
MESHKNTNARMVGPEAASNGVWILRCPWQRRLDPRTLLATVSLSFLPNAVWQQYLFPSYQMPAQPPESSIFSSKCRFKQLLVPTPYTTMDEVYF